MHILYTIFSISVKIDIIAGKLCILHVMYVRANMHTPSQPTQLYEIKNNKYSYPQCTHIPKHKFRVPQLFCDYEQRTHTAQRP